MSLRAEVKVISIEPKSNLEIFLSGRYHVGHGIMSSTIEEFLSYTGG